MLPTMQCIQITHNDTIQQRRDDYLNTLIAPMDGMWESAAIAHATFWDIQGDIRDRKQYAGYFCLDSDNCLLRFHLSANYQAHAQEIFAWIVSTYNIQQAITSTIEPFYFSLCLSIQESITPHSYLFRDNKRIEPLSDLSNSSFRTAENRELDDIVRFYHTNTEGSGEWIEEFLQERIKHKELFVWYHEQTLVATGECIPSSKQKPYADLGMVVAQSQRGQGLGSSMLIQLKKHCYEAGLQPICSCTADNLASKKAIEKAGFISEHSMVNVLFSSTT